MYVLGKAPGNLSFASQVDRYIGGEEGGELLVYIVVAVSGAGLVYYIHSMTLLWV